jgi:hypothetical protein
MEVKPSEIRILVHAWNPESREVAEVARTSRDQLTNENLESAVAEALDLVLAEFSAEEIGRWMPQISVWLWSDRGLRASMNLSRELVQRIASINASLDYDPYMSEPAE